MKGFMFLCIGYAWLTGCLFRSCSMDNPDLRVLRETTGPYQTNSYLIYDKESGEAALIDPGWRTDTLVTFIRDKQLRLKYIFITHGHSDHYYYVPELKKQFPDALWCLNKEDYDKILQCPDWPVKAYGQDWVVRAQKDPGERTYLDFNTMEAGIPDIFVEGGRTFELGTSEIKTIHTPGHSPGGICYYTGNLLFSGDMLFYRSVGNLDHQTSDRQNFIKSVRELYRLFPDSTVVYPGHGPATDIGSEKKLNRRISENKGEYDSN